MSFLGLSVSLKSWPVVFVKLPRAVLLMTKVAKSNHTPVDFNGEIETSRSLAMSATAPTSSGANLSLTQGTSHYTDHISQSVNTY